MPHKEVVKVYRVTDRTGRGMYGAGSFRTSLWTKAGLQYANASHQPIPREDGINCLTDAHFFAFANPQQMRSWVGEVSHKLEEHGAQVRIFEVPKRHVLPGGKQVAFKKRHARLVGKQPLNKFLSGEVTC